MELKILHATLLLGDATLDGIRWPTGNGTQLQGGTFTLNTMDKGEATRPFSALAENGKVPMPLQEDLLYATLRSGHRPVRHPVGHQPRETEDHGFGRSRSRFVIKEELLPMRGRSDANR
jgi:hypothetical protein